MDTPKVGGLSDPLPPSLSTSLDGQCFHLERSIAGGNRLYCTYSRLFTSLAIEGKPDFEKRRAGVRLLEQPTLGGHGPHPAQHDRRL